MVVAERGCNPARPRPRYYEAPMNLSTLPAPRSLLPGEAPARSIEVARTIAQELDEIGQQLTFDLETLAGAADLTPACAAVGAELLATIRRAQELGRLLKLTA